MQEVSRQDVCGYRFDDVTVDLAEFRVHKNGVSQKITPRSFEVLTYLLRNPGRVVEKQELFENIWRENFVSDNALTRVVREIRQVIGDDAGAPRYIETVPKRGYRFIAEVEKIERKFDRPAQNEKNFAAPEENEPPRPLKRRKALIFAPAALLILLTALGVWLIYRQPAANFPAGVARTSQITNWSGLDKFPAISPDGSRIAYSSDQSGSFEIFVRPLAPGAKEIQITADGQQNFQPAWSPDGQRIAFHSKRRGGIWIVPATGGAARQLTEFGSHPAFSPDGKQIAFQSSAPVDLGVNARTIPPSTLWLVSADGGEAPRQLTQTGNPLGGHGSPAWSPDGKRIAFNVADLSSIGIWSVELENGKTQKISLRSSDPVYAPDGKSLFFSSRNGLWQIPVSSADGKPSGNAVQIAEDGPGQIRHPSISADGKKIVYEMLMSTSRLTALALDKKISAEPFPLLQNSFSRNTFPVFSPDGGRIAYTSDRAGSPSELWVMNSDGQNPVQASNVSNSSGTTISNWMADGAEIACISTRENVTRLFTVNLAGGMEKQLFTFKNNVQYARLSPDNRKIAYNSKEDGTINVWLADLESGVESQLTFDAEFAGFPVWSPDGKWLALQIKRGDDTHVALMPAEGGEPVFLTNESGQSWIHSFSPDGEQIVFAGQRADVWNIYTVSRSTREQKKLTNYEKLNSYVRYPAWSPLGDKIVFEYAETTGNIWLTEFQ